jgi:hypothetical protein
MSPAYQENISQNLGEHYVKNKSPRRRESGMMSSFSSVCLESLQILPYAKDHTDTDLQDLPVLSMRSRVKQTVATADSYNYISCCFP